MPGERRPGDEGVSNVTLTALAPDGRPLFRGRVPEQSAAATRDRRSGHVGERDVRRSARAHAAAHHGAERAGGQVMDSSTNDVTVPDYTTPQVSFGTPRLFRARTPRDVQAIKANPARRAVGRPHVQLAPSGCSSASTPTGPAPCRQPSPRGC